MKIETTENFYGAKVMVTGGAGFLGSHLVDNLLKQGVKQVVVLDDLSRARKDWYDAKKNCEKIHFVVGNILDESILSKAMEDVSIVYHLAAVSQVMKAAEQPEYAFLVNVIGTNRVAEAASRAGVSRFVFASSREVYGDHVTLPVKESSPLNPKNIYGVSKIAAEIYLKSLNSQKIETIILRLSNVYGPGDKERVIPLFIDNAMRGAPLAIYGSDKALDFIWIDDVVKVMMEAGLGPVVPDGAVNVGSGKAVRLDELAYRIRDLSYSTSLVQITNLREPEIENYEADISRAVQYWGMKVQDDPLYNLGEIIRSYPEQENTTVVVKVVDSEMINSD
ncbi:MAG: NAD-dependent epimerase/dehydratase family protein [Bacteroidetes bacterium]|nr:NAD-dependent epimerase/dehydratase family protein [Bacteroidota bacterium]